MTNYPEGVMKAARECAEEMPRYLISYDERGEQRHPSGDFVHYSDALDYLARAITADRKRRVVVKGLEWDGNRADTGFGTYCYETDREGRWLVWLGEDLVTRGRAKNKAEACAEAMAAAQSHRESYALDEIEFTDEPAPRLARAAELLVWAADSFEQLATTASSPDEITGFLESAEMYREAASDLVVLDGEAKAKERLAAAEADAERLAEALETAKRYIVAGVSIRSELVTYAEAITCIKAALAAHEAKGVSHE